MSLAGVRQTLLTWRRDGGRRTTVAVTAATAMLACVAAMAAAAVFVARQRHRDDRQRRMPRPVPPPPSSSSSTTARCGCGGGSCGAGDVCSSHIPHSNGVVDVDEDADVDVRVIYGSESGNAEEFARGLTRQLCERGVRAQLINPDAWPYLDAYLARQAHASGVSGDTLMSPLPTRPAALQTQTQQQQGDHAATATTSVAAATAAPLPRRPVYLFVLATHGAGEPSDNFVRLFAAMTDAVATEREKTARASEASTSSSNNNNNNNSNDTSAGDDVQPLPFAGMWYAVFGLGSSAYRSYCRNALMTKALLKKGGACELYRVGFGDRMKHNDEDAFEVWQREVMRALHTQCGLVLHDVSTATTTTTTTAAADEQRQRCATTRPWLQLRYANDDSDDATADATMTSGESPAPMRLLRRQCVAPPRHDSHHPRGSSSGNATTTAAAADDDDSSNNNGAVYKLSFDAAGRDYRGGDYLAVYARNPPGLVARLVRLLALSDAQLRARVELRCGATATTTTTTAEDALSSSLLSSSSRLTVRQVLERHVDLCGKPKRLVLRALAQRCVDAHERDAFLALLQSQQQLQQQQQQTHMATHAQQGDGNAACAAPLRTVVDYMERFPSCCGGHRRLCNTDNNNNDDDDDSVAASLAHVLDVLPRMQPRYYSIASDRLTHGDVLDVYVRVVDGGLASHYLCERLCVHDDSAPDTSSKRDNNNNNNDNGDGDDAEADKTVVDAFVRCSSFHLPAEPSARPVIFVAAGTGVAGVVGMCYRREALLRRYARAQRRPHSRHGQRHAATATAALSHHQQQQQQQRSHGGARDVCGPCVLLFGVRHAAREYFVRDELQRWTLSPDALAAYDAIHPRARLRRATAMTATTAASASLRRTDNDVDKDAHNHCDVNDSADDDDDVLLPCPVLSLLDCAFSRDQPERYYVTHLMHKHAAYLYSLLTRSDGDGDGAVLFVSGDAAGMARDVERALCTLLQEHGKMTPLAAMAYVQRMEREQRYLKDIY